MPSDFVNRDGALSRALSSLARPARPTDRHMRKANRPAARCFISTCLPIRGVGEQENTPMSERRSNLCARPRFEAFLKAGSVTVAEAEVPRHSRGEDEGESRNLDGWLR